MLGAGSAEVERQPVASHGSPQPDLEVALECLQYVGGGADAVLELLDARTRAALGVVENLAERGGQFCAPHPFVELREPPHAGPPGCKLRAEVRAALCGLAHLRAELGGSGLVEHPRVDHHPLVGERPAVGGHRPGRRTADVRVMGPVGRERDQRGVREHRLK